MGYRMLERVNFESSTPVYSQIENEVQFSIASGKLKAGDQLPTTLKLAKRLGINFNTVYKAYRDLETMGVVQGRRGIGVFVKKDSLALCRERCYTGIVQRLFEVIQEAKATGFGKSEVRDIASQVHASDSSPYSAAPHELMKLARP